MNKKLFRLCDSILVFKVKINIRKILIAKALSIILSINNFIIQRDSFTIFLVPYSIVYLLLLSLLSFLHVSFLYGVFFCHLAPFFLSLRCSLTPLSFSAPSSHLKFPNTRVIISQNQSNFLFLIFM